ncbi:serine protease inhibitor swm-1-like [Teleopsis dalmanni]|uniref:serine protease inhibitor swm-1-like n=1 Tax=Teleopsis dalmanni TaxID=139649 RepID=UPI0018CE3F53|nr:serine protease inhibitor swm-1-like [Teleopsis dalmanni]
MFKLFVFVLIFQCADYISARANCDSNERYFNKTKSPSCDVNCQDLTRLCHLTTIGAVQGCYCRPGFARNLQQKCIPVSNCAKDCFPNEKPIWPNKTDCELVCSSKQKQICYQRMERKCVCSTGYCRNQQADCILI